MAEFPLRPKFPAREPEIRLVDTGEVYRQVGLCRLAGTDQQVAILSAPNESEPVIFPLDRLTDGSFVPVIRVLDVPKTMVAVFGDSLTIVWSESDRGWISRFTDEGLTTASRNLAARMTIREAVERYGQPPINAHLYHLEKP